MIYTYPRFYNREERFEMVFEGVDGKVRKCYPRSKEKLEENKRVLKESGRKLYKVTKLYPFSTEKNQHNFELISNVAANIMRDMENGDVPYDEKEYDRLWNLREKAQKYFGLELPVAWIPYPMLAEAKELAATAIEHRTNACIEAGRLDLVKYC